MPHPAPLAHRLLFSDLARARSGDRIEIVGDEAHHAVRVKRVREGETVGVLDGLGHTAAGVLAAITGSRSKPALLIELGEIESHAPITPALGIAAALPKGDRLDRMIDQLAQLGVTSFRPLLCERSQRKGDSIRPDKLARIGEEAMKQCGRPWAMRIEDPIDLPTALRVPGAVVADASGIPFIPAGIRTRALVLIGPEGGWSQQERDLFVGSGVPVRRVGRFVLRVEAAACAAAAIVMRTHTDPEAQS